MSQFSITEKILIALALLYYCFWSPTGFFSQMAFLYNVTAWWVS